MSENILQMKPKSKRAKDRAEAFEIAGLLCDALEKLPAREQQARLAAIQRITIVDRRSSPKRVSTRASSQKRLQGATLPRKRARR